MIIKNTRQNQKIHAERLGPADFRFLWFLFQIVMENCMYCSFQPNENRYLRRKQYLADDIQLENQVSVLAYYGTRVRELKLLLFGIVKINLEDNYFS